MSTLTPEQQLEVIEALNEADEEREKDETVVLTSRAWKLYNLLIGNPFHWWSQKEICDAIDDYHYIDDPRNHCAEIGTDRILINENPRVDKIIVTKKHHFKIATFEEYKAERNYHIRKLKSQVAQIKAMDSKFEQDGQGKLLNNILDELKPENEQFHETFVAEGEN